MFRVISSSRGMARLASGSWKIDTPRRERVERTDPVGGDTCLRVSDDVTGSKSKLGSADILKLKSDLACTVHEYVRYVRTTSVNHR